MMEQPAVSVILSVFNGERFLAEAIDSVLAQTCQDFELIIVDDASTDATPRILERYRSHKKIVILHNEENRERAYSRNRAIQRARGKCVAILDADDICLPSRLETQFRFMETHPDVDVLGGMFIFIDDEGREITKKQVRLQTHPEIAWATLFSTPIAHSTAMMRTARLKEVNGYDVRWPPCEDADLWIRLLKAGARFHNLEVPLTKYRTNLRQKESYILSLPLAGEIRRRFLSDLLERDVTPTEYAMLLLSQHINPKPTLSSEDIYSILYTLLSLFYAMKQRGYFILDNLLAIYSDLVKRNLYLLAQCLCYEKVDVVPILKGLKTKEWLALYWQSKKISSRFMRWLGLFAK